MTRAISTGAVVSVPKQTVAVRAPDAPQPMFETLKSKTPQGLPAAALTRVVSGLSDLAESGCSGTKNVAARFIAAGTAVFHEQARVFPQPNMHTVQIGIGRHIDVL